MKNYSLCGIKNQAIKHILKDKVPMQKKGIMELLTTKSFAWLINLDYNINAGLEKQSLNI